MLFKSFLNCFCISHFEEGLKKHYQNSVYLWTLLLQPRIQHFSVLRYPRLALMPSYRCQIITEQLWFSLCCFYVQIRALFIWLWPHSDTLFFAKVLSCPLCMGLSEGKSTQAIPYVIHNGPFPLSFPWLTPPPTPPSIENSFAATWTSMNLGTALGFIVTQWAVSNKHRPFAGCIWVLSNDLEETKKYPWSSFQTQIGPHRFPY